jgi:hypothetical protein
MEDIFILNGLAAADEVSWLQTTGEFSKDLVRCLKTTVKSSQKMTRPGLADMGDHQELVLQQNITHWSHMEDIEWSSSSR